MIVMIAPRTVERLCCRSCDFLQHICLSFPFDQDSRTAHQLYQQRHRCPQAIPVDEEFDKLENRFLELLCRTKTSGHKKTQTEQNLNSRSSGQKIVVKSTPKQQPNEAKISAEVIRAISDGYSGLSDDGDDMLVTEEELRERFLKLSP